MPRKTMCDQVHRNIGKIKEKEGKKILSKERKKMLSSRVKEILLICDIGASLESHLQESRVKA